MNKLVTIITVTYNCEQTIGKTLESVLAQRYKPIEYLIIDGASTDKTVEKAETYREQMEKMGVSYNIYSEQDKGIYDAMNKGVALSKGRYIGIINSGDWYENNAVETAVDILEKNDNELVFGNIRIVRKDGSSFIKKAKKRTFQTSRDWNHPTMFVKASLYKNNPFLCKGIHDDYGFYLKMVKMNVKIAASDQIMANFCMGGTSNHRTLKEARKRIRDRYLWCYRVNGYSRWYLIECILTEMAKWLI